MICLEELQAIREQARACEHSTSEWSAIMAQNVYRCLDEIARLTAENERLREELPLRMEALTRLKDAVNQHLAAPRTPVDCDE